MGNRIRKTHGKTQNKRGGAARLSSNTFAITHNAKGYSLERMPKEEVAGNKNAFFCSRSIARHIKEHGAAQLTWDGKRAVRATKEEIPAINIKVNC